MRNLLQRFTANGTDRASGRLLRSILGLGELVDEVEQHPERFDLEDTDQTVVRELLEEMDSGERDR